MWSPSQLVCLSHTQSNTKIMIRGKGATKEGKFGRFGLPQPGEDEELHALITGQAPEAVKIAVDKVSFDMCSTTCSTTCWTIWSEDTSIIRTPFAAESLCPSLLYHVIITSSWKIGPGPRLGHIVREFPWRQYWTSLVTWDALFLVQIKAIIQSGIDVPGNENEIKKMQLMQLAELNGTFKPIDVLR